MFIFTEILEKEDVDGALQYSCRVFSDLYLKAVSGTVLFKREATSFTNKLNLV